MHNCTLALGQRNVILDRVVRTHTEGECLELLGAASQMSGNDLTKSDTHLDK
jgi:hypothetical protein